MLYTEKLAELGVDKTQVSVNLQRRIKAHEKHLALISKLQEKENRTERQEDELQEALQVSQIDNDELVKKITLWDKNKDTNAARVQRLHGGKTKEDQTPPVFEITDDVRAKLAELFYSPEEISQLAADQVKQIIEAGTQNPNYQPQQQTTGQTTPTTEKKSSGGGALILVGLVALVGAAFGINYYMKNKV